jgi:hypothetical protein
MRSWTVLIVLTLVAASCTSSAEVVDTLAVAQTVPPPTTTSTTSTTTTTTTTTLPSYTLGGTVVTDEHPLWDAVVTLNGESIYTDSSGLFSFGGALAGTLSIERPGYLPQEVEYEGGDLSIEVVMEVRVVRALRVSRYVSMNDDDFDRLLGLAAITTVNSLVFDTKDETGKVLYETAVPEALELGFINPVYDPIRRIGQAKDAGLYTITRVVSFEDGGWVSAQPDFKLAGSWVNPYNPEVWEYPLGLAVEACELGFDEIQFDYVRFPAGKTAAAARRAQPLTQDERIGTISGFLGEAVRRLHPLGCAVSADIFGIVTSAPDDQGLGQRPEELSQVVDALSPMLYPSHYSDGWLGFADPNDHPGPVVAHALDSGIPRLIGDAAMRPWLQAFYYNGSQILAQINEAEARGAGWILWNASGNYQENWLPPALEE